MHFNSLSTWFLDHLPISGEVANYWIQHFLIILLPGYLMTKGRYAPMFREQENDENRNYMLHHNSDNRDPSGGDSGTSAMAWPLLSYSVFSLYHWLFLQSIGQKINDT